MLSAVDTCSESLHLVHLQQAGEISSPPHSSCRRTLRFSLATRGAAESARGSRTSIAASMKPLGWPWPGVKRIAHLSKSLLPPERPLGTALLGGLLGLLAPPLLERCPARTCLDFECSGGVRRHNISTGMELVAAGWTCIFFARRPKFFMVP